MTMMTAVPLWAKSGHRRNLSQKQSPPPPNLKCLSAAVVIYTYPSDVNPSSFWLCEGLVKNLMMKCLECWDANISVNEGKMHISQQH